MRRLAALACLLLLSGARADEREGGQAQTAARLNAQLAIGYLRQGDVTVAREKVEKALRESADDANVQTAAALVFERLQESAKAREHYARALHLEPNNPEWQNNYAVFECRNGNAAEGQRLFEAAARNPAYRTPEVAYANAGVCARGAGDETRAEQLFRKAIELRSDYPDALVQMADLTLRHGNSSLARGFLQRYFAAAPRTAEALALGVRIERQAGDSTAAQRFLVELAGSFPGSPLLRELEGSANQ